MVLIQNEKVSKMIHKHLNVRSDEKKEFGEVFTPINLVLETLNLPKNCWKNPNLKWLDPSCGIGNFPVIAYYKLMDGLKNKIKNKQARSKHIIENMLYMVELNPANVRKCKKIFKEIDRNSNPNIQKISYFDFKPDFEFDIIMGNPPWNKSREDGRFGGGVLWDKFIHHAFKMLKINGYLCFITPSGWRGPGRYSELWEFMSGKQIIYIHVYSTEDSKRLFNIVSRFDVYIIKNKPNSKKTLVVDEHDKKHRIDLTKWPFLPNYAYKEMKSILTDKSNGIDVIFDTVYHNQWKHMSHFKKGRFKYPVIHGIKKHEIRFMYSSTNKKGHFGISKVIMSHNDGQYKYPELNDYKGLYGMSDGCFGIPIKSKKEGEMILKAIHSPKFKKILAGAKWSLFQTPHHMFEYFKKDFYKLL